MSRSSSDCLNAAARMAGYAACQAHEGYPEEASRLTEKIKLLVVEAQDYLQYEIKCKREALQQ